MKVAFFAYKGDPLYFFHVLLNALELTERGFDVKLILDGAATALIPDLASPSDPISMWEEAKNRGIIAGVCEACAGMVGTLESAKSQGLVILSDMSGHPSMSFFMEKGYSVINF